MLNWLRRVLRRWLLEQPEPEPYLECHLTVRGRWQTVRYTVLGAVGARLLVIPQDGSYGARTVGVDDAVDRRVFWKLWKHHSRGVRLQWDDGEECRVE